MKSYLSNILPRIQQFSKKLENTSLFVDIPWIFIDEEGNKLTYIFRQNNELLISKAGEVTSGKWEYLPFADSLLIDIEGQKRLYKHGFLDEGLMIMRKDETENLFITINSKKIPDLDVERYINTVQSNLISTKSAPVVKKPEDNVYLPIVKTLNNGKPVVFIIPDYPSEPKSKNCLNRYVKYHGTEVLLPNGKYKLADGDVMKIFDGKCIEYDMKDVNKEINALIIFIVVSLIFISLLVLFFFNL